ncbi:hypothetical protein A2V49_02850 [candidate division WWE3 bacterium RBG_19FT_COMBO_34_6]|uniref:histidine kinase n=1 Tax=candidate division WWE3 bacterium RBG_19FT_COMBO_34_6 TaxID=1802612 RepID=A0A1F4UNF6_UNCKA|nr:MAG: hypothetical protein A2V49_02850 [candidate division WWE3 bacterium RBG_19FT_COMBO_34_6]
MFKSARIKLTAWYLAIIMFITLSFSFIFYEMSVSTLKRAFLMHERRIEDRLEMMMPRFQDNVPPRFQALISQETIREIRIKTISNLIVLNIVILSVSGILGYFLAGLTLKPIEGTMEKQKAFVADAAHELKTPLTAIKTNLEVNIRNKELNIEEAKNIMRDTVSDIDSLSLLANSLLKDAHYGNLQNTYDKEDLELSKIINDVINKFRTKANKNNIQIISNLNPAKLYSDKKSINELISILLDNAIKFNNKDGFIYIDLVKEGDQVKLSVKDTGIGIKKDELDHIFDRFYKADSSRNKKVSDGFGLGLSIAKQIVESNKGTIEVQSKINEGTIITVIFNV